MCNLKQFRGDTPDPASRATERTEKGKEKGRKLIEEEEEEEG